MLLPYLDQAPLYAKIDLTKPWDDPASAEARQTHIHVYSCPSGNEARTNTQYLAIVGPRGFMGATRPRRLEEITDGPANTLAVVEVGLEQAVPWMSPLDADEELVLGFNAQSKLPHSGGMHGLFADGAVRSLSFDLSPDDRRAMLTIDGNEPAVPE